MKMLLLSVAFITASFMAYADFDPDEQVLRAQARTQFLCNSDFGKCAFPGDIDAFTRLKSQHTSPSGSPGSDLLMEMFWRSLNSLAGLKGNICWEDECYERNTYFTTEPIWQFNFDTNGTLRNITLQGYRQVKHSEYESQAGCYFHYLPDIFPTEECSNPMNCSGKLGSVYDK